MEENPFMTAEDVAKALHVSKSFAYKIIQQFNRELESKGFFTLAGRVNRQYFQERMYYEKAVKEKGDK